MSILNFFKKPDLSKMNLQELISQISPEQAATIRTMIIATLLDEKNFNPNNPFFDALKNDTQGHFKIMKDEITSKNYYHHKISIQTNGMFKKEEFINPILNYLNTNTYFEVQQKVYQKNLLDKIALNDSLINQIDKLIVLLSSNNSSGTISISEKNSIPELVEKKDRLISEKQYLLTNENIFDKIIKEESSIINIRDYKPLLLNNKILFPLILILVYLISYSLLNTYKNKEARIKA